MVYVSFSLFNLLVSTPMLSNNFSYRLTPNQEDSTFYLKYTNMVTPDVPLFLATVIPRNASLSLLTTISNHWSTKQHSSSDTTHFLNKLDQLGHLPSNAILVTLDVSSLYTNIPHNEGIDACRHYLNTRDQSTSTVRTETICDLIRMILTMNTFELNNTVYIQTLGTAMGTRMAPS